MFTGIIENIGHICSLQTEGSNIHIQVQSTISASLKIDQSIAHNGVCLTVVAVSPQTQTHTVTAIHETLLKTNIGQWQIGTAINLERCLPANGRIDGHFVQGHIDCTAECVQIVELEGSWYFTFHYLPNNKWLLIDKGSICIDGTSLTVVEADNEKGIFSVAIIPYTFSHTIFHSYKVGTKVNIEFDILGKYMAAYLGKTIPHANNI